jgi:hypothetical protein
MSAEPMEPFSVGQLVLTSLEAFLNAAALHLGDALPDGRRLDATDPQEAWRALLGASALLNQFGPLMKGDKLVPYEAGLAHLLERLGQAYPDARFPAPAWLVNGHEPEEEVPAAKPVAGTGLPPRRGSGPLFPPR